MKYRGAGFVHCLLAIVIAISATSVLAAEGSPPSGHTVSTGKIRPLGPPAMRPAAIFIRSSAMSAPVSTPVKIRAEVHDQYGAPVKDGTIVHFWAGAGKLSAEDVKTQKGYAATVLQSSVDGPVRLLAASGMVQASASLYFFPSQLKNGPLLLSEDYADGPGLGKVFNGQPIVGEGMNLKAVENKASGLRYALDDLTSGRVEVTFSSLSASSGAESILSLLGGQDSAKKPHLLVDVKRGNGRGKEIWLLRSPKGKTKAVGVVPPESSKCVLTLSFNSETVTFLVADSKGRNLVSMSVNTSENSGVRDLWIFGAKDAKGPDSVVIHKVDIWGR